MHVEIETGISVIHYTALVAFVSGLGSAQNNPTFLVKLFVYAPSQCKFDII